MLTNKQINHLRHLCGYQSSNHASSLDINNIYSTKYIDTDNICVDLKYLQEYKDSNGFNIEYFNKTVQEQSDNDNTLILILVTVCIIVYLVDCINK